VCNFALLNNNYRVIDVLVTERVNLRRLPALPREARTVSLKDNLPTTIVPVPYETTI
jgi:large subunit ribosomal protein L21e